MATPLPGALDPHPASEAQYPWDEWFDGRVWELKRGVDWPEHRTVRSFQLQIGYTRRRQTGRSGSLITTKVDDDTLRIQAR